MGQPGPAQHIERKGASLSDLPEETYFLVQDALRCFSLVQVLNGAIASLVTVAGYLYKHKSFTGCLASLLMCVWLTVLLHGHACKGTQPHYFRIKPRLHRSYLAAAQEGLSLALSAHYVSVRYSKSASTPVESAEVCISWASWCSQPQGELCLASVR